MDERSTRRGAESGSAVRPDLQPAVRLDDDAAVRLDVLLGRLVRTLRKDGTAGLGPGSLSALVTLVRSGPMRLGDLAAKEGVAPPTLTRIVAVLEEGGHVGRTPDPDDRRAVVVAATPSGVELVTGVRSARAAALRDRIAGLSDAHRAALVAALPALEALVGDDS